MATSSIGSAAPVSGTSGDQLSATLARLGAVLVAAERLASDIEQETTADGFALATALQCVLTDARGQLRIAERALAKIDGVAA